jgi:FMN phosphatase YigB (HAD superfamily)
MRSGTGVEYLQSEDRFRELLLEELNSLKRDLERVRLSWERFSRQPEIPELPLPFGKSVSEATPSVSIPGELFPEMDILSLDIFDTCLRRVSGEPESIFEMLECKMAAGGKPCADFAAERVEAENSLRKRLQERGEKEDVSLGEIYRELKKRLGWSAEVARNWEAEEKALEQALVIPVQSVRELAIKAHAAGLPVIYITEMYLPVDILEAMLKGAGFPVAPGSVFASGTIGLSKGSGRLYQFVRERFPGKRLHHIGDNPETDTGLPESAGIRSTLIDKPEPPFPDALSNLLASVGASADPGADFWHNLGHRIVGPLAVGWMLQLLRNTDSLEQVLFLTRDGYFPKKAFEAMAPLLGINVVARTCFSSRRLLGLASMDTISASDWDFLLKPAPGFRIRDFFERIDVGPERYAPVCQKAGMDPDEVVCHHRGFHDPSTKDRLYSLFLEVMDAFYPLRDGIRQRLLAYLESLSFPVRASGIVDIGWNGSSFECLERLCGEGAVQAGFYLAIWESRQSSGPGRERLRPYLISGEMAASEERLIRGGVGLLEFLMGSPNGSVVDLQYKAGEWTPVYAEPDVVGSYERRAYEGIERGFDEFLGKFVSVQGYLAPGDGKACLRAALEQLVYNPAPDEIERLGAVSHVEGWGSSNRLRLLPRIERLAVPDQRNLAYAYSGWKGAWRNLELS